MNIDIKKKYEIINSAINNFGDTPFTISELFVVCEYASRKYDLRIDIQEIIMVIIDLYDSYELDKKIDENGVGHFQKSECMEISQNIGRR